MKAINTIKELNSYVAAAPKATGCNLHGDCLTCPFAHCRYDKLPNNGFALIAERDTAIRAAVKAGATIKAIVAQYHISRRSVHRITADLSVGATP